MEYKYERELPTGLGDRLGCISCVSAMARAIDLLRVSESTPDDKANIGTTKIHLYWCEKSDTSSAAHRFYPFNKITKYLKFPSNLIFHTRDELEKLDYPKLSWLGGEIPATLAYDCIPTLAHKTFNQTMFSNKIDTAMFKRAYDQIASEIMIENLTYPKLPEGYGVIHVRGGDKANWSHSFISSTVNVIQLLKDRGLINWILVTDDPIGRNIFSNVCTISSQDLNVIQNDGSDLKGNSVNSVNSVIETSQNQILEMMRDIKILLGASCIVQHVAQGWSAFSNIPASLRNIPIINTYPDLHGNLLMSFYHLGGQPGNYYRYDEIDKFMNFVSCS